MRWLCGFSLFRKRVALSVFLKPSLFAFTLVCVKPFYSDGNASMRVAAFRVIKTIHLHAATRWIFLFFFFFFSLQRLPFAARSTRIRGYSRPFQLIAMAMLCSSNATADCRKKTYRLSCSFLKDTRKYYLLCLAESDISPFFEDENITNIVIRKR